MIINNIYTVFLKRLFDIICSLVALILLSPLLAVVALLVKIKLGSPVIFKQDRPGLNEKIFTLYKFRSMVAATDKEGKMLTDKQRLTALTNEESNNKVSSDQDRLTPFGRQIRALSLDELPELVNILKGNMSFVGPRPLSTLYLPYYNEKERLRHTVKPGLTGLAQVNGRNTIAWEERFTYDIEYVNHVSFKEDIYILLKTVAVVFRRDDIAQAEQKPIAFHLVRQQEWNEVSSKKV